MAGHSQWSNIKFRKERQDAKKNKVFTKFSKEIYTYARNDPDPKTNTSLRNCILNAKSNEVPSNVIERSIKKAVEKGSCGEEVMYECVRGNSAFIVLANTDNKARTSAEVREVLKRNNVSLGKCIYLFQEVYMIITPIQEIGDDVLLICEKVRQEKSLYIMYFERFNASIAYELLKNTLTFAKFIFEPYSTIEAGKDEEDIISELEELDDVYQVFSNTLSVF